MSELMTGIGIPATASSRERIAGVLFEKSSSTTGLYPVRASSTTTCAPTKPAPPVTRTRSVMANDATRFVRRAAQRHRRLHRRTAGRKKPGAAARLDEPQSTDSSGCLRDLVLRSVGPVDQFDQRHRRRIALPEPELEDAQVTARACRESRPQIVEELGDDVPVAQARKCEPAIGDR